jgi:hypothetical protein
MVGCWHAGGHGNGRGVLAAACPRRLSARRGGCDRVLDLYLLSLSYSEVFTHKLCSIIMASVIYRQVLMRSLACACSKKGAGTQHY